MFAFLSFDVVFRFISRKMQVKPLNIFSCNLCFFPVYIYMYCIRLANITSGKNILNIEREA